MIILSTFYFLFSTANAATGIVPCSGLDCNVCHLFIGVKNIIDFLTKNIAFPLAAAMIIYGGIMLLISGASESRKETGKKALQYAVWGLVITFAAWLIIDTILKAFLTGGTGNIPGWGPWNGIPSC